jgi:hypothetical protein
VLLALASLAHHNARFDELNREIYDAFHTEIGAVIRRIDPHASAVDVTNRAFLMTSLLDGVALQIHAASRHMSDVDERIELATRLLQAIATGSHQLIHVRHENVDGRGPASRGPLTALPWDDLERGEL